MAATVIQGWIVTTDPIPSYGGLRLPPKLMHTLAESLRDGRTSMNVEHDPRDRLEPRILGVDVRETDTDSLGVWVELEVEEAEWEKIQHLGGFSASLIEPLLKPDPNSNKPALKIAADAVHFDGETVQAVVERLEPHFSLGLGRLYQLSELPDARVIIEMAAVTLQSIPASLLSSVLYDALKGLFTRKGGASTDFSFTITEQGGQRSVQAHLRTDDGEHLKDGLATLKDIVRQKFDEETFEFDPEDRQWKGVRQMQDSRPD